MGVVTTDWLSTKSSFMASYRYAVPLPPSSRVYSPPGRDHVVRRGHGGSPQHRGRAPRQCLAVRDAPQLPVGHHDLQSAQAGRDHARGIQRKAGVVRNGREADLAGDRALVEIDDANALAAGVGDVERVAV